MNLDKGVLHFCRTPLFMRRPMQRKYAAEVAHEPCASLIMGQNLGHVAKTEEYDTFEQLYL